MKKTARWWDPSRRLLRAIRDWQRAGNGVTRRIAGLRHRFWSVVTGADIPANSQLGGGLMLPHPNGIVIHPEAQIGPNCIFFQQVTIGVTRDSARAPRIGAGVEIGAGARILGAVSIGDGARIGANAVVTRDVPAGAVAAGVPARILRPGPEA